MLLLNPGPVTLTERVRRSMLQPDLCHRESEFYDLQDEARTRLLAFFGPVDVRLCHAHPPMVGEVEDGWRIRLGLTLTRQGHLAMPKRASPRWTKSLRPSGVFRMPIF